MTLAVTAAIAAEYPRFAHAVASRPVVLEAGDMLYLPAYWFHAVESAPDARTVAVNLWWDATNALDAAGDGVYDTPTPELKQARMAATRTCEPEPPVHMAPAN